MKNSTQTRRALYDVPAQVNFIESGPQEGAPVILVHGLAASLHDWDDLMPELAAAGFHAYALDLLGHGESPKPHVRDYKMKWLFKHFAKWIDSLHLSQPPIFIAHSIGAYLCMQYALRHPQRVRALVFINPFYSLRQLPKIVLHTARHPRVKAFIAGSLPLWAYRASVDFPNYLLGRNGNSELTLSEPVLRQAALDYKRSAPGWVNLPATLRDLTSSLPRVSTSTLLLWGDRDQALAPDLFAPMLAALPNARGQALAGGHAVHQANPVLVNRLVLEYLSSLNK